MNENRITRATEDLKALTNETLLFFLQSKKYINLLQ